MEREGPSDSGGAGSRVLLEAGTLDSCLEVGEGLQYPPPAPPRRFWCPGNTPCQEGSGVLPHARLPHNTILDTLHGLVWGEGAPLTTETLSPQSWPKVSFDFKEMDLACASERAA